MIFEQKTGRVDGDLKQRSIGTQSKLSIFEPTKTLKKNESIQQQKRRRFSDRLRLALRDSRLAQIAFGCTLILTIGVLWFTFLGESSSTSHSVNNFRWRFGPQLDYVNGPPPV